MGRRILPTRLLSSSSITSLSSIASNHSSSNGNNTNNGSSNSRSDGPMRSKNDSTSPSRDPGNGNGLALKVVIMKVCRLPPRPELQRQAAVDLRMLTSCPWA